MDADERPRLVQHWVVVTDELGREHLEARWAVEGDVPAPAVQAVHAA